MRNGCFFITMRQSLKTKHQCSEPRALWISFIYSPLRGQKWLISLKEGNASLFSPASPLSACPLWISLSDKIPWRLLAAVLVSAHLMIQLCYATSHLGPGPPEISQFVCRCPDSRTGWSLSTSWFCSLSLRYSFLANHCMTDLGLSWSMLLHLFDSRPLNWFIHWPGSCIMGIFPPFIFYITHHSKCDSAF